MKKIILFFALFFVAVVGAENVKGIVATKEYPKLGVTELTLENGMKVILRPTHAEADEICIQILAPRGYSSLKKKDRVSGRLAASIAWESGVGPYDADQLSSKMYRNGVDLFPNINAFSRTIDGSTDADGLDTFMEIVHLIFTDSQMKNSAMKQVVANRKRTIINRPLDIELAFEDQFISLNTQNLNPLRPLPLEDLGSLDLQEAGNIFRSSFSDPSEFTVVLVGYFDIDEVKEIIAKRLATIPKGEGFKLPAASKPPEFPTGITVKKIFIDDTSDSLTRLTFPIIKVMDQNTFEGLNVLTQVIETRLRNVLREEMESSQGVDVAYQMPLFPSTDPTWLTIQFRSEPKKEEKIRNIILKQLEVLRKEGPTDEEIEMVRNNQTRIDEFWLRYNCFWQANLSNYYIWGWDPNGILHDYQESPYLSKSMIQQALIDDMPLDNYTVLISEPKGKS